MLAIQHVATRKQNGLRAHVLVVSHQQTTLTRVNVLVSLRTEAANLPPCTAEAAIPLGPHGVCTVFHHRYTMGIAERANSLHIGNMASHVRD